MIRNVELTPPPVGEQSCRLCGVRRRRDEPDEAWIVDIAHVFERVGQLRAWKDDDGLEHYSAPERPFSRRHLACEPTAAFVVQAVTGLTLDEDQAREALRRHGRGLLAGDRQTIAKRPWSHLLASEVESVRRQAESVLPPPPASSPDGRCGVCGRGSSDGWSRIVGLSWSDGRQAPMCADCSRVAFPAGGDLDRDLLKIRATAMVADVRPSPVLRQHGHYGMRLAAEVLEGSDREDPDAAPWTYRPQALSAVRDAVRAAWPELIVDADERAVAVAALARRRSRAAEEAARLEVAAVVGAAEW